MKIQLPNAVTRTVARQVLITRKHSPTILFVTGVAGVVTSTVLACKSTLKVESVLDEHQKTALDIKTVVHADYSERDRKSDMTLLYVQSVVKFTKLYGPAIVVGGVSIGMLTKSHNILNKRNAGLTAAYAVLEKGFQDYRKRVVGEYGEDKDRELRFGTEDSVILADPKTGKKKETVKSVGGASKREYAKLFDEFNQNWSPNRDYNVIFLRGIQNQCNDKLRSRGHLFLNEVLDALGMDHTRAGSVTGWLYGKGDGDQYVDFKIFSDRSNARFHDFCVGLEGAVWLDFNCDGTIWDKI